MSFFLPLLFFFLSASSHAAQPSYEDCFKREQQNLRDEQQAIDQQAAALQSGQPLVEEAPEPFLDTSSATLIFNPNAGDDEKRYDLEFEEFNLKDILPQQPDETSIEGQCHSLYGL